MFKLISWCKEWEILYHQDLIGCYEAVKQVLIFVLYIPFSIWNWKKIYSPYSQILQQNLNLWHNIILIQYIFQFFLYIIIKIILTFCNKLWILSTGSCKTVFFLPLSRASSASFNAHLSIGVGKVLCTLYSMS